jgi:hypothetical protein
MAIKTISSSDPRSTDPQFAGGLSQINPQGLNEEDLQKIRDVTDEGIKALEHRYDNPNWFKVAAGFAKPQLGGFLASLGSAAEAMGENVEQQRENILPVTNLKIQRELSNALLGQKIKQKDMFKAWQDSGMPMDEKTYTAIAALGNDTEIAKAAKQFWEQAQGRVSTTGKAEELASNFPRLDSAFKAFIDASANPTADPAQVKSASDAYYKNLDASRPPQIDVSTWNGMSRTDKQDAIAKYVQTQQKVGMTEEEKFKNAHDSAIPRLQTMETIRDLALGKGLKEASVKDENGKMVTLNGQQQMQKLLGMFGGDNPFEVVAKAAADGKLGDMFKNLDTYVRQGLMTPEARAKFEEMAKLLAANQVQLRNGAINPTDAYTQLQQASQPGIYNSQQALIGILDLMAHAERNNVDNYRYIIDNKVDARHIGANEEFYRRQGDYAREHNKIAISKPSYDSPTYYNPYAKKEAPASNAPQNVAPAGGNAPQNSAPARKSRIVGTNGNWFQRDDKTGKWVDTGEKA